MRGVSIINGRLKFDSKQTYEQTLQKLRSLDYGELANWETQNLPDFTSMRHAFSSLTEADMQNIVEQNSNNGYEGFMTLIGSGDNREAVMNVDAGFVATLINKDGLIQIGEEVVKVGYNESKSIEAANEKDIQTIITSDWKNAENKAIKVYPVKRVVRAVENAKVTDRLATCEDRYKSDRRFRAELWETSQLPAYSGAGARAKHQNRFLRVWWADNAPVLRLQVQGEFRRDFNPYESVNYDSGDRYNQNIIEWTFDECFNFSCVFTATGTVIASGIGDNNAAQGCSAIQ